MSSPVDASVVGVLKKDIMVSKADDAAGKILYSSYLWVKILISLNEVRMRRDITSY